MTKVRRRAAVSPAGSAASMELRNAATVARTDSSKSASRSSYLPSKYW